MMIQRSSTALNNTSNGNGNANHLIPFSGIQIETTVTNRASVVADWIRQVYSKHSCTRIVVAIVLYDYCELVQLCVDKTCLIFQLHHMDEFPQALQNFFDDSDVMFVGVDSQMGLFSRLRSQIGLNCSRCIQVIDLATSSYASSIRSNVGPNLLSLAKHIEGLNIEKPIFVEYSNWKAERLSVEQIRYASIDAYATYRIARKLLSANN